MKVVKDTNNVSKELVPKKLEKGQVVKYQLLNGKQNPDPEKRKFRPVVYGSMTQIPTLDRIFDPVKQEHVDIAVVQSFDAQTGKVTPKPLWVPKTDNGMITITGGNIADEELYEFLELTNYNESNPNRDASVEPLFKRIDDVKDAKERTKKRSELLEAMTYVSSMTNGQIKAFAASMNWNENDPIELLQDRIEALAQTKPGEFSKLVLKTDELDAKTFVKRAVDSGKVSYDPQQHKLVNAVTGETLIKFERSEGVEWLAQAAEYITTHKNGQKVQTTIKKLVDAK